MAAYHLDWTARRELSAGWTAALAGARDMLPLIVALTPLGLLAGASVAESSVRNDIGLIGGVVMYGASAHITAISLLGSGAGGLTIVAAVVVINARGLVYSAALSTHLRHQPAWFRWGAPYLLVDPLFALVSRRADSYGGGDELRAYYLGSGLTLLAAWVPVMVAGVLVGPALPDAAWIDFAIPALFIGFLVPGLGGRSSYIAAGFGGAVALAALGMPGGIGLIVATLVGAAAGIVAERIGR
ncbi:MAG: AzlC family ABC transporter permease [Dehalococcoidia bacterium]